MPSSGKDQLNVSIEKTVKERFREKAKQQGTSATELINQWVNEYLEANLTSPNLEPNLEVSQDNETQTQQEIESLKAEMEGLKQQVETMQKKTAQQFKVIDDQKIDRATLNGWAVPYPLPEIENRDRENPPSNLPPETTEPTIEDKSPQQPTETPINAEIGTELTQKELAKRLDAQAKKLKQQYPDDESIKKKVTEQDIGYYFCDPFDEKKPEAKMRNYIGFCKKYDPDGYFWEWNGEKGKSKRFTATKIQNT